MKDKIKAVFFDRDGTLIHEKPGTYLSDPAKVRPYKTAAPALAKLAKLGYTFFIVSNQSGIGRGYFTAKEVDACHARLKALLKPAVIKEIAYCPHGPDDHCACRKPAPLLGEKLIQKSLEELSRGRTVLTIAHRLTTIKNADDILVITDNGIEEHGTHDELLQKEGIYYHLYNI